jgi:hypothetical protein
MIFLVFYSFVSYIKADHRGQLFCLNFWNNSLIEYCLLEFCEWKNFYKIDWI